MRIQEQPDLRLRVLLEFLDHQLVAADAGGPVNTLHRIARDVFPDPGGMRRDVHGFAADCPAAWQKTGRRSKFRNREQHRQDNQGRLGRVFLGDSEDPKRISGTHGRGTQYKSPSTREPGSGNIDTLLMRPNKGQNARAG